MRTKYPYSDLTEAHLNALLQSDSRDDQQNAIASSQAAQDLVCFQKGSLDIISASVESSILSSEVISNTAQVAVLETKTIESHSSDGSTVTLYDGETEDLTSVWQDIHILTLSASSGNAYTVISDQLVDLFQNTCKQMIWLLFAKKIQQKPEFVWHRQWFTRHGIH